MSHHSRLCAIVLDCKTDDLTQATQFWSKALGKDVKDANVDNEGRYAELRTADDEPIVLLQRVEHDARVHLDIESDDIDAEADRLEKLGAKRVAYVKRWWVMEAPSGHRFCVVRPQRAAFGPHLNTWEENP